MKLPVLPKKFKKLILQTLILKNVLAYMGSIETVHNFIAIVFLTFLTVLIANNNSFFLILLIAMQF